MTAGAAVCDRNFKIWSLNFDCFSIFEQFLSSIVLPVLVFHLPVAYIYIECIDFQELRGHRKNEMVDIVTHVMFGNKIVD